MMSGRGFVRRAIGQVLEAETWALEAASDSERRGLLQRLDPRVKVVSAALLLVGAAASHSVAAIAAVFATVTFFGVLSSLTFRSMALRVWIPVLLFTLVIGSPAVFTTPGTTSLTIPGTSFTVTEQGVRTALLLVARVLTAGTIAYVLVVSTSWPRVLAALRRLHVPAPAVALLAMTYRYIFLLTGAAHDMLQSRESRAVGRMSRSTQRSVASAMMGSLMLRSLALSNDVHRAMQSRGFRGSFDSLETFRARGRDLLALAFAFSATIVTIWSGR
jgi:cobalt ECF transporter T component CbiQ